MPGRHPAANARGCPALTPAIGERFHPERRARYPWRPPQPLEMSHAEIFQVPPRRACHGGFAGDGLSGRRCRRAGCDAAERNARNLHAEDRQLRLRQARGDDPDARRREAQDLHPGAEGRERRAHVDVAHALQRVLESAALQQPEPGRRRAADERHRGRGRLHHRVPGRARKIRLGRRLRDEPAAHRPAQPDRQRPRDRHLRHDRLAGEERAREQRPRRHDRRIVRRLHDGDVHGASAPGAEGGGAVRADGGRLDRRRLVPQRRVPAGRNVPVHLRPGSHTRGQAEVVVRRLRFVRRTPAGGKRRQLRSIARTRAARLLAGGLDAHELRRVVAATGGGQAAGEGAADRADDDRRGTLRPGGHLRRAGALQGARAERSRGSASCTWCSGPGITGRGGAMRAPSDPCSTRATRPAGSAAT